MRVTQSDFTAGLLNADQPAPEGVINPDGSPAIKRYDVYRNNVAVSLSDALATAFPVMQKLVGDEFFRAMAGVYLRAYPPHSPLMMFYGTEMPDFLRHFDPVKHLTYLPDIAKLELALRHSYHAADAEAIDANAIAGIDGAQLMDLRLTFAPSLHVLRSDHPIYGIYRANTDAQAPKPSGQAENVLITRPQFDPQLHPLSVADADCLGSLMAGNPLGVAMTDAGADLDLGTLLGLLLQQSAIIKLN